MLLILLQRLYLFCLGRLYSILCTLIPLNNHINVRLMGLSHHQKSSCSVLQLQLSPSIDLCNSELVGKEKIWSDDLICY